MRAKRIIKIGIFVLILALFALAAFLFSRPQEVEGHWMFPMNGYTYHIYKDPTKPEYLPDPEQLTEVGTLQWTADEPAQDFCYNGDKALDGAQVYVNSETPTAAWIWDGEDWYSCTWAMIFAAYEYVRADGDYFVHAYTARFDDIPRYARYLRSLPDYSKKTMQESWDDLEVRQDWLENAQLWGTARLLGDLAGYQDMGYLGPEDELVLGTHLQSWMEEQASEKYAGAQFWMVEEYPNILLLRYQDGTIDAFWRYGELPPEA